jgi:short-chain fatty acids transporter
VIAARLTRFAERFIPDAWVFALVATIIVFFGGLIIGVPARQLVQSWGEGFPELFAFTTQMCLVIITGYVVASARPVARTIVWLAEHSPHGPRAAVAWLTGFALVTAWLNWGFSLVFSSLLAREVARRRPGVDYRALAAASLLGLGSIWAQGLSGSAVLQMATPGLLPDRLREVVDANGLVPGGIIDLRHTTFLPQSLIAVAVEIVVVVALMAWAAPTSGARDAQSLGMSLPELISDDEPPPATPGEHLERSRILLFAVVALGGAYLALNVTSLTRLNVNNINIAMLLIGMALHGTPARVMSAVRAAVPATWGVLLQFPFYGAIAGMIGATKISQRIADLFVAASTPTTFPALVAGYSALLGVFVPSGGGKWLIEAQYVMSAAHAQRVHLGWAVACYDLGEALANLVQPFWMLPVLALLGLKARDVMGYTLLVFVVLAPIVLGLVTLLGAGLPYPL